MSQFLTLSSIIFLTTLNWAESKSVLNLKFRKLHKTLVNNVNPASEINFLFQERVIRADNMRALVNISDPQQQCTTRQKTRNHQCQTAG